MILGYLDCSQRNISTDMQRDIINQYTRENVCDVDVFLNDPDIKNIKDNINFKENTLIMANITKKLVDLNNKCLISWRGHKLSKYWVYRKLIKEGELKCKF